LRIRDLRRRAGSKDHGDEYAAADPSKVAILKVTVQREVIPALDFSTAIDPHIFNNGVITVQLGAQSDLFHRFLLAIEHLL
jgi:hypothetical protein